jgi:hypothetical protein
MMAQTNSRKKTAGKPAAFFDMMIINVDEYRYLWFLPQKWNQ